MLAGIPQLAVRTDSTLKKFMYLQQSNDIYVVNRQINTRAHDAIVFQTCIPKIGKHKTRTMYRGIQLWNSLGVEEINIEHYNMYKEH